MEVLRRVRLRWTGRDEQGFGLLELVVASTVMMTALTSMAYVATNAFSDIALARERQTANALLDESIERLRALPYDTVSLGMRTSDLPGDPRVLGSGTSGSPYRLATSNHRIVHVSTNQLVEPLVPNVTAKTVDGRVYSVRMYLTHFQDDPTSGAVTATAYVDWFSGVRNQGNIFMRTSTVLFSPAAAGSPAGYGGPCLTTATHPFSGPCVPFFTASAVVKPGKTTISNSSATHVVDGPAAATLMVVEQTSAVQGWSSSNGVTLNATSGTPVTWGYASGLSKADNDPASDGSDPYDKEAGSAAAPSSTMNGTIGSSTVGANTTGAGTYSTTSATSATTTDPTKLCPNTAGTSLTDALQCGTSTGGGGGATTLSMGLDFLGLGLGTLDVVQQDAVNVAAHTNRDDATSSTGGGVCTSTSSAGCIHAKATRSVTAFRAGGVPVALRPATFGFLVELTGYADSVTAESGIGASAPTSPATGTVRYWNGLGYTSVAFASGTNLPIAPLVVSSGTVTVTITSDLQTGTESKSSTTATCLSVLACRTRGDAVRSSPIRGTLNYDIRVLGVSQLSFSTAVDLGDLTVSASYADPPTP